MRRAVVINEPWLRQADPLAPRLLRRTVELALMCVVAAVIARFAIGELFEISGPSMAPTVLGRHVPCRCQDCGFAFACGSDDPRLFQRRVLCPNCGYAEQWPEARDELAGERVLVSTSPWVWRPPRRWELVAYRSPRKPSQVNIKRIVGLPGERITLADGDVYADGALQRKTLYEQRGMAILVHDAAFVPRLTLEIPARWRATDRRSRWQTSGEGFAHLGVDPQQAPPPDTPPDWLTYHHERRKLDDPHAAEAAPVTDAYAYNQTHVVRVLHPVRDLMLSARLRVTRPGKLLFRATDGALEFVAVVGPGREVELLENGRSVSRSTAGPALDAGELRAWVSLVDRQFLLALNGRIVVERPYERPATPADASTRPFALGTQGAGLEAWDLQVWRDVYYDDGSDPPAEYGEQACTLQHDEVFVLGDNSPQSSDSRDPAQGPGVPLELLVGKPLVVYWPAHWRTFAGWRFQVPDLERIRYIH